MKPVTILPLRSNKAALNIAFSQWHGENFRYPNVQQTPSFYSFKIYLSNIDTLGDSSLFVGDVPVPCGMVCTLLGIQSLDARALFPILPQTTTEHVPQGRNGL